MQCYEKQSFRKVKSYLILLVSFFIYYSTNIYSQSITPKIMMTEFTSNITEIAHENWNKETSLYYNINLYINDLKKWNKHITNFSNIPPRSRIYLEYPYNPFLNFEGSATLLKDGMHKENWPNINLSLFFSKSQGNLNERTNSNIMINSKQNSPLTIGFNYSDIPFQKKYFYSGSFYYSSFTKALNEINQSTIDTPAEIGATLYINTKLKIPIYFGLDYEKLTTFNLDEVIIGSDFISRSHQIIYYTLGIANHLTLFDNKFFIKFSYSNTLISASSQNGQKIKNFKGSKFIIFASLPITKYFSISTFYKKHILKGIADTTIDRIGFAVGLKIF